MAARGRKAGERATAPTRDRPIRKPKSAGPKCARPKSGGPKSGKRESGKPKSETARLKSQVRAARDRQNASAEILRAIASTSGDAERPLQQIAEITARLFGAPSVSIQLAENGEWTHTFRFGTSAERVRSAVPLATIRIGGPNLPGTVVAENRQIHIPDLDHLDPEMAVWPGPPHARAAGTRTMCGTPLRRERQAIGALIVYRDRLAPFTAEELALLQSFADQAAIAIENARLFNETKEALERQTATADILKVIASSPSDVQPVFDVIVERAVRLCGARMGRVYRFDGNLIHMVGGHGLSVPARDKVQHPFPRPAADDTLVGRVMLLRRPNILADLNEDETVPPLSRQMIEAMGARSQVTMPMLLSGEPIGAITLSWAEPRGYTDQQIALLQTFASQAVIAIENARLFNETQEALERQTATADILKVIASSPSDTQPVFEAIARRANTLIGGFSSTVFRFIDGIAHLKAFTPTTPAADEVLQATFPRPVADFPPFQMAQAGEVTQIPDTEAFSDELLDISRARGYRSMLFAPLMNDGVSIGFIAVTRVQPGAFADHHVQLLRTFADQAVIAIENARLFEEVQERTRDLSESLQQQTATSEVLRVISASPGELEPVFQAMLENAVRLCEAKFAMLILYDEEENEFRAVGKWNLPPAYSEFLGKNTIRADPKIPLGRVAMTKRPVQIADVLVDQSYLERFPGIVAVAELGGARTLLQVPMLKENELVGTIGIYRQEVRPFSDKQIALVQNFAAQAVIAIENARLLNELRQRTDDLTESLEDLRTAQDRLIQTEKLASLGQLTAGIAHEIKNPLNFVNNFSALSAELTDELNDLLKTAALNDKMRVEVDELTEMLKDNLEKIVQHGRRADSIVKNMLQHSRAGSGELRPVDINAVVDESLNLAYHGARAEKAGFNITLERNFDLTVGIVDVYPQEITRVLLNLISNGFYATNKRRMEAVGGFKPMLSAATKNLGDKVEIRIRDNGTGIPTEVKDKIFNPFFTTKPAGEGTGLGLSMSHDIIVKQHGGSIDVETEPGQFTEFKIVLPRTSRG
jgi:two-component system NtrC family sensor kinase